VPIKTIISGGGGRVEPLSLRALCATLLNMTVTNFERLPALCERPSK